MGPWLHPGLELAKIRLLRLAPADEALVVGGNARRLILARRKRHHMQRSDHRNGALALLYQPRESGAAGEREAASRHALQAITTGSAAH
jgi:hypothetical protein